MLSTLFRNLQNHTVVNGGIEFTEGELIDILASLDFATPKTKTCTKGYSCGKTCISPNKNCRNPLEGQTKNYAEFIKLTQQPKETPVSLADFDSVVALGEKIANKYYSPPRPELIQERDKLLQIKQETLERLEILNNFSDTPAAELEKAFDDFLEVERELVGANDAIAQLQFTGFEQLREDLIKAGRIDKSGTDFWAGTLRKRTKITKKAELALKEAYQLLGGNIPTLGAVGYTDKRAYASKPRTDAMGFVSEGFINVGKNTKGSEVIFHEVGHHLEYSFPELVESANAFITKRSKGRSPQSLRQLTGIKGYKSDEMALPDEFIDPYVGKLYKDRSTEVISMGVERFTSSENMQKFRDKDPEHFHYILGVIAHVNKFKA